MKEKIHKMLMAAFWVSVILALVGMVVGAVGAKQLGVWISCASAIVSFGIIMVILNLKVEKE